ncbi:MAG TPA: S53 family peptidase [Usitatibacter sp.]|jgi:kumamolisin|nr:S53 family peptidase [Usitatibacter sp.]
MPESRRIPVAGSERAPLAAARATYPVARDERFEVTVRIRRKTPVRELTPNAAHESDAPEGRRYLSREAYARDHAVDPADIERVERFAREQGLVVVHSSAPRRSVFLSGTVSQFERAFGTKIDQYESAGHVYRGRTGPLTLPEDVAAIVEGVFGIDDRPAAIPHIQRPASTGHIVAHAAQASFTPPQLARVYEFPEADGAGQCVGIIELGGGFRTADLHKYFQELKLTAPAVKAVRVDGARNDPSTADGADGEVMLDIEVVAGIAPKATIVVYFAPNSDKGFIDAITTAIHDETNRPSAISISWGGPEKSWTKQAMHSMDQAFQTASALGVTICCAAGDAGSGDENPDDLAQAGEKADGLAHADFPASSPYVLACGGTRLAVTGTAIASETVWDDDPLRSATGGGVSDVFALPAYQASTGIPPSANPGKHRGRGLPDVAAVADPQTGYRVRVDGEEFVIGGTSAVAPLWAGLVARLNQELGHPVGFLNPMLYGPKGGSKVCRDITSGNNGAYRAKSGWDACTGWGSPNGVRLVQALKGGAARSGSGAKASTRQAAPH